MLSNFSIAQSNLTGTWQGAVIRAGQKMENATPLYLRFTVDNGILTGHSREELFDSENYAVKQITGKGEGNQINFKQTVVQKKSKSTRTKWCRFETSLTYNPETGYLAGKYESTDCKRNIGKIILYRSEFTFSEDDTPGTSQLWYAQLVKDLNNGFNAPEIRKLERDNFVFEPVYFDFDKFAIRSEHEEFLNRLVKVVKGHSDLRVKVTGHTDSDGSNHYNDTLSKRRAESIIQYFVKNGLNADRLEFDFKGETQPADTNSTPDGKQRNRRVDFSFI